MAECMGFPETIDEFLDVCSFIDDKNYYTNGSILIPLFRVKQAIEHYYGKDPKNKIETNIFDIVEEYEDCTVQVLKNSITGECSVGWYKNN